MQSRVTQTAWLVFVYFSHRSSLFCLCRNFLRCIPLHVCINLANPLELTTFTRLTGQMIALTQRKHIPTYFDGVISNIHKECRYHCEINDQDQGQGLHRTRQTRTYIKLNKCKTFCPSSSKEKPNDRHNLCLETAGTLTTNLVPLHTNNEHQVRQQPLSPFGKSHFYDLNLFIFYFCYYLYIFGGQ